MGGANLSTQIFLDEHTPVVILARPQMGENIGAAARAMKNCGLANLRLIAPRDGWPNPAARPVATVGADILERAEVFETLADALHDICFMVATSARSRDMEKPVLTPRLAAKQILKHKFEFLMRPPPSMTYRQKPRLREEIRSLMSAIDNTTNPPTAPQIERIVSLIKEVDEQEETILSNESELLNLNRKLSSLPQILY